MFLFPIFSLLPISFGFEVFFIFGAMIVSAYIFYDFFLGEPENGTVRLTRRTGKTLLFFAVSYSTY